MSELPVGWEWVTLGAVGEWFGGGTPSKSRPEFWENGTIPWLSPKDMGPEKLDRTRSFITDEAVSGSTVHRVPADSVAVVVRSGILERTLPVAQIPFETTLNQDMRAVAPHPGIEASWVAHYLRSAEHEILRSCSKRGTTVASINVASLMDFRIPLPSTNEQRRIVAILEDHLSRLDAGRAYIDEATYRVATLWSSVLDAAHSGVVVDDLLSSPQQFRLGEVAAVQSGIQKQAKRRPVNNTYSFLRVANVSRGSIDLQDVHEIELFNDEIDHYRLEFGDLLVVEGNGSIDQLGRAAMWHGKIDDCVHQNHLIRVRPGPKIRPRYLEAVWNSPSVSSALQQVGASTSGLHTLSVSKLKSLKVPVPSLEDQDRIIDRVSDWHTRVSHARSGTAVSLNKADHLRRSLLTDAFAGRLVQQDPSDEPASVLLDRIRVKREASARTKPKRTKRVQTARQETLL